MEELKKEYQEIVESAVNEDSELDDDKVVEWIETKIKQAYIDGSNDCYKSFRLESQVGKLLLSALRKYYLVEITFDTGEPKADIKTLMELWDKVNNYEVYEKYNAENGWGLYIHFVPFVEKYLEACEENPDAEIDVSR